MFFSNLALRQLVRIFFGRALDQIGQKCRYLTKNARIWAEFGRFWAKIHFLGGWNKNLVSSYQGTNETPFPC